MKQKISSLVIPVWKPVGWTPLKAVEEFKKTKTKYAKSKISYAGRLDPMAEGILLLLIGEENKKRHEYEDLKKTYESEIILGISTDSFDGLGIIESIKFEKCLKEKVEKYLKIFKGKQKQVYPPYSSKAVNGKSLYWWARNNKLNEIELPIREIEIYSIELIEFKKIKSEVLVEKIIKKVKLVEGDFRQNEIIKNWKNFGKENMNKSFIKIKISISCSAGTYIRRITSDLGQGLGIGAFALSIKRKEIGQYQEKDCVSYL